MSASNATTMTDQVRRANSTGLTPVVFIHGLWLLPHSWDRWAAVFDEAGYASVQPGWPDDPETVEEAKRHPEVFAHKTVGQVADHYSEVIGQLTKEPAVIGHSFGGLLAQIVAGRGFAAATVAIDPAPFRGVLPLPFSALKSRPHHAGVTAAMASGAGGSADTFVRPEAAQDGCAPALLAGLR
jgi:non-heme chloroperoxidase